MSTRRQFLKSLGTTFALGCLSSELQATILRHPSIKAIEGSWFEFQHHSLIEGKYWNPALAAFTAEQWDKKNKRNRRHRNPVSGAVEYGYTRQNVLSFKTSA